MPISMGSTLPHIFFDDTCSNISPHVCPLYDSNMIATPIFLIHSLLAFLTVQCLEIVKMVIDALSEVTMLHLPPITQALCMPLKR